MGITASKLLADVRLKKQVDSTHRCYNSSLKCLKTTHLCYLQSREWKAFSDKSNWGRWVWRSQIASEESTQRPGVMGSSPIRRLRRHRLTPRWWDPATASHSCIFSCGGNQRTSVRRASVFTQDAPYIVSLFEEAPSLLPERSRDKRDTFSPRNTITTPMETPLHWWSKPVWVHRDEHETFWRMLCPFRLFFSNCQL